MAVIDLTEEQKQLKERGNALMQAKDFQGAVEQFSTAIALPGATDAGMAVLYSNRAAAYMNLVRYADALADGVKATELNPEWNKAWARKGAALQALGRFQEAADAFDKAGKTSPSDTDELMGYFVQKQRCLDALKPPERQRASGAANANATAGNARGPQFPLPAAQLVLRPWSTADDAARFAMRALAFLFTLVYTVSGNTTVYGPVLALLGAVQVMDVLATAGRPTRSMQWAEAALSHPKAVPALLCVSYAAYEPSIVILLCVQCLNIAPLLWHVRALCEHFGVAAPVAFIDAQLAKRFPGAASQQAQWASLEDGLQNQAARFELTIGLVNAIKLLTGNLQNLVPVLLFTQTMKLRYVTNAPTRLQLQKLDGVLAPLAQRAGCSRAYARIKQVGVAFVTPPDPNRQRADAAAGGFRGMMANAASASCSIM